MGRLIGLASENLEPIHYPGQRTYRLSLYYCIVQLCKLCNGGSSVSCAVLHTAGLRRRSWAMQARTLFARLRSRAYGRMNNVQRFRFPYTDMSRSPAMFVRHDRSEFYLFDTKRPTIHWNVKPSSLTRSGYVPLEPPCSFGEPGRFGRT